MPLQATSGAASYDAFGGGVPVVPNYIEDVFSSSLYTANASTQTITNGIDLAGKGGLVWSKSRSLAYYNELIDSARGIGFYLVSNDSGSQGTGTGYMNSFNNNGFTLGPNISSNFTSGSTSISWTFRKQPKFFDVVTYTGTGSATTYAHNLGSTPGCIIVKQTSGASNWRVYHVGMTSAAYTMQLNQTNGQSSQPSIWNSTAPTSTVFSVGADISVNDIGQTYVAYLFAHNAGGFGLTGTDNVISCGIAYSNSSVNLGFEPQWILAKDVASGFNWQIADNMRGNGIQSANNLQANLSDAESNSGTTYFLKPTATGFDVPGSYATGGGFIYIAIRRGPMKVPTDATKVFKPVFQNGAGTVTTNFPVSLVVAQKPDGAGANWQDRLRGGSTNSYNVLYSYNTNAEASGTGAGYGFDNNNGYVDAFSSSAPRAYWNFQRAPSFFDEVCYTGSGAAGQAINHNLAAVPQLLILKKRNAAWNWRVYSEATGNSAVMYLDDPAASGASGGWNNQTPTATQFFLNGYNTSGDTYVAYLFATCAGVSKVGSYTGTGALQTVNCGFTSGARFVLIKRTDSTGDWWTYDSARGITSGNDPYLFLNSTAAEVTSTNYVDTDATGFKVTAAAPAGLNASGGTYIFLAIA